MFWYRFLAVWLLPFAFMRLYWRGRKAPAYRLRWRERLGFAPFQLSSCIWVHAVSLGETIAAVPLIRWLQKTYPHLPVLVTNMTPTGSVHVVKTFGDSVQHCYLPYDVPCCLKRFLKRVNPQLLVIMETELWPVMITETERLGVPMVLANARLSARSARRYSYLGRLTKNMLNQLTLVAAQNAVDGQRYLDLGLAPEKLTVTGSIKFDMSQPADIEQKALALRQAWQNRPVWIAGSTHDGEHEQVITAHQQILQQRPDALLILVPRHPEKFGRVQQLCESAHLTVVTRSSQKPVLPITQVFLGDSMGEMLLLYAAADVAFVGGSLVNVGGHNLLEPAALAKPGLTGPHYFNFKEITQQLIKANAVACVADASALAEAVLGLFADAERRQQAGQAGLAIVMANRGALQRLCDAIKSVYT